MFRIRRHLLPTSLLLTSCAGVALGDAASPSRVVAHLKDAGSPVEVSLSWNEADLYGSTTLTASVEGARVISEESWRPSYVGTCRDPESGREELVFHLDDGGASSAGRTIFLYWNPAEQRFKAETCDEMDPSSAVRDGICARTRAMAVSAGCGDGILSTDGPQGQVLDPAVMAVNPNAHLDENGEATLGETADIGIAEGSGIFNPSSGAPEQSLLSTWLVQTVTDEPALEEERLALAFAPNGQPAIGYSTNSPDQVKYAIFNGSSWTIEVADALHYGGGIDLAFDPGNGQATLSYFAGGNLYFARRGTSNWSVQTVESKFVQGDMTSLAYSPAGRPSISYFRWHKGGKDVGLKYANWTGSAWQKQLVDAGYDGRYNSLAFDPSGQPAIAYSADEDGNNQIDSLKYARFNGSSWTIQIVPAGNAGYPAIGLGLAFNPQTGNPAIAHTILGFTTGQAWVYYVEWNGAAWVPELVATNGRQSSLAFDSGGIPYVSYRVSLAPWVAKKVGGVWIHEMVSNEYPSGVTLPLAIAPDGQPAICYYALEAAAARYAKRNP